MRWPQAVLQAKKEKALSKIPAHQLEFEKFKGLVNEVIDPVESGARLAPVSTEAAALERRAAQNRSGASRSFMKRITTAIAREIRDRQIIEATRWQEWLNQQEPAILAAWEEDLPEPTHAGPIYDSCQ